MSTTNLNSTYNYLTTDGLSSLEVDQIVDSNGSIIDTTNLVTYTGASKDVDLGNYGLFAYNVSINGQDVQIALNQKLNIADASNTYLKIYDANSNFLKIVDASANYLKKLDAAATYATISTVNSKADKTYVDSQDAALQSEIDTKVSFYDFSQALLSYLQLSGGQMTGTLAQAIAGASAQTTAFFSLSNTANHYDGNPSTTYVMSGPSGYLTLAKKTTRNDTEACLMLGTNNELCEIVSRTSDNSDWMPLNYACSECYFVGINQEYSSRTANPQTPQFQIRNHSNGQRLYMGTYYTAGAGSCASIQASDFYKDLGASTKTDHGNTLLINPLGGSVGIGTGTADYLLDVNGTGRVRGSFYVGTEGNASSQIFFGGTSGDAGYDHTVIECRKYAETGEGSELLLFKGNDPTAGSLVADRIRLRGQEICFDTPNDYTTNRTAENIRFSIKGPGHTTHTAGDNSFTYYGPNSSWGSYLYVGATPNRIWGTEVAQVITTNGNLHLDSGDNRDIYLNYYKVQSRGAVGSIFSYGPWTHAGFLSVEGGSKIVVQNNTDGGYNRGIWMWNKDDSNWGIYMASSGYGKSLSPSNPVACAGYGFQSHAIRFRVYNSTGNGFIFENSDNGLLASIRADGYSYFSNNTRITGRVCVGQSTDTFHSQFNIRNPNGSYTHFGSDDYGNCNYIRGRTIINSGYFEIGDSYVWRAPLDITISVNRDNGAVRYFDYWGGLGFTNWYYFSSMQDTAGASRFMAYSDIRKKKNIKPVENVLEKIDKIRIVSYDHIDRTQPHNYYGIIAQEIEQDYPQMVNKSPEFLPNIYEEAIAHMCTKCGEFVILEMKSNIDMNHVGKKLKIITFDEDLKKEYDEYTEIIAITDNRIKVKIWKKQNEVQYEAKERVFVYGTCEDDVLTVDKTQFGFMAVAGVQELKQQNEQMKQVIDLQNQKIEELQKIIVQHNAVLTQIIDQIKKQFSSS